MEIFKAENIVKTYANHRALNDVSITIPENTVYGLLGPNGAGKTTLIRIINQITAPDSGNLYFKGRPLKAEDIHRIGYLPEERGLYKKMKVGEQAIYLAQLKGLSKSDAIKRLKMWFEKFEISAWWDKKVEELSKGMQQKIQFIVTILHEPELLIFDEPFSGFDPINANLLKREILELRKKGATVIFSTHNMGSVEEVCDHITLINKSQNILSGDIFEVKNRFKTNTFHFNLNGKIEDLSFLPESDYQLIEKQDMRNNMQELTIKSLSPKGKNQLIKSMAEHAEIVSFNELIPSMNDIFINVVENFNNNK
ncbi:MAG: ABC transporter ATP-binding protein [Bacteroidales bacterium]|jgi:ABC-2 type transport system ATP-binding protein|nr:ABC transporter ATP-binding protein [Bacteroidales bacterium]